MYYMDVVLTKQAEKLLSILFKEYQSRIKAGQPRSAAKYFAEYYFRESVASKFGETIYGLQAELRQAGLIRMYVHGDLALNDIAIAYAEQKTKKSFISFASFLSKFIP